MRFRLQREVYRGQIACYLEVREGSYATELVVKDVEPGEYMQPLFSMPPEDAQALMDELWHVGLRPTEGSGSAGQLAATERHLKDMQRLVFEAQVRTEVSRG